MERPGVGIQIHGFEPAEAAHLVRKLGVDITIAHLNWGSVERDEGDYDWSALDWWDAVREELGGQLPRRIWTLYTVHMNERGPLPDDLARTPFDAHEMRERFEAFVAEAAERAGWKDDPPIVVIANEVNIFADGHPDEMPAVLDFLDRGAEAIRRHAPQAQVVNSCTFDTIRKNPELVVELNRNTDLAAFTWYELGPAPDFKLPRLSDMEDVVSTMVDAAGGKPVLVKEIGLPSAPVLDSSEDLQAKRVDEMFDVLGERHRAEIEGCVWLTVNDWPVGPLREYVKEQFPFFDGNEGFLGFLTSNGIRTADGTPKTAYGTWLDRIDGYRRAGAR